MSILMVVVGAGASHDCFASASSTSSSSNFTPPLVNDLFHNNGDFAAILQRYEGAEMLGGDIRRKLAAENPPSLEALLREIYDDSTDKLLRAAWEIPLYLQELLGEVSEHYVQGPNNYDALVRALEESNYEEVVILTLNYDLLLEKALGKLGYTYHNLAQYIDSGRKIKLIKIHGSVNWGKQVATYIPNSTQNFKVALDNLKGGELNLGEGIEFLSGHHDAERFVGELFFYPALAVPVEGKTDFVCDDTHVDYLKQFLSGSVNFLCIGFSGHDNHILRLFESLEAVPKMQIVGYEGSARRLHEIMVSVNPAFQRIDPEESCHEEGFDRYVLGGGLENYFQ